jgi:hypothetical protein
MLISGLTEGKDFTVAYFNNTKPGTGTVRATGINNYTGTKELTFTISTIDMSSYQMILSADNYDYSREEIKPFVSIYPPSGSRLIEYVDYQLYMYNNINPGTATVVANGINTYSGQITKNFTINAVDIGTLTATYGYKTEVSPYVVDNGEFGIYTDIAKTNKLVEGTDYQITNISRVEKT